MEVIECNGILEEPALQNGGSDSSLQDGPEDDISEDEENDENWGNVLPVEVNLETGEDDVKPEIRCTASDSESDFYGFEDGQLPSKRRVEYLKRGKVSSECPHCSYKTRRKDHFKRHVLRHPEQTLYPDTAPRRSDITKKLTLKSRSCPECGYSTGRLDHLKRHIMRHTGEKPYSCACGYSTTHGIHLKRHLLRFPYNYVHYAACTPHSSSQTQHEDLADVCKVVSRVAEGGEVGGEVEEDKIVKKKKRGRPRREAEYLLKGQMLAQLASRGVVLAHVQSDQMTIKTEPSETPALKEIKKEVTIMQEKPANGEYDILPRLEGEAMTEVVEMKEEPLLNGESEEWSLGLWPVEVNLKEGDLGESEDKKKMKRHSRTLPHVCGVCGYSTMRGDHFKRHLMRHTGEKPYSCKFCDYRSTHAIHLKRHMSTHTDDRPFRCEFCPFRAIRPHHLRDHVRLHTGERPYLCAICGFSAAQSGNYRAHMRTHSSEKPHVCEICGYSAVKSSNLASHMRTHTGETGHACQECDYRALKPSELARHVQRVHPALTT